jgi:nickel-type superoxide dismutase maturation protease
MLRWIRVRGESMPPLLEEGDLILVLDWYWLVGRLRVGDLVVFQHPIYGTLVKQVERLIPQTGQLTVRGTRPVSTDSQEFGPIPFSSVLGKAVWRVRKPSQ